MATHVGFLAVRIACGALGAMYGAATIPLCVISPMLFDSPGSERNGWTRALFVGALLAPLAGATTLVFAAQPWLLLPNPAAHAAVVSAPVLLDVAVIAGAMQIIARLPNGLAAPLNANG